MSSTITQDVVVDHPPASVWTLLTHPAQLSRWFLPVTTFTASPGATFLADGTALKPTGYSPRVLGTITAAEPPLLLAYRWDDADTSTPTGWTVTFQLTPAGAGTHLRVAHSGFDLNNPQQARAHAALSQAWQAIMARLRTMPAP